MFNYLLITKIKDIEALKKSDLPMLLWLYKAFRQTGLILNRLSSVSSYQKYRFHQIVQTVSLDNGIVSMASDEIF